jgi:hypothetical protein
VIQELADNNQLTVRIAYNLFTQKPKEELDDFKKWTASVKLHSGTDFLRHNGAGEMLVFSAADFEDFLEPRPDLPQTMEQELEPVVRHLVEQRWPFRLHATYNESITRMLDVFEKVNRDIRSMACRGSSTTPKPSPRRTSSVCGAGRRHRHPGPHGLPGRILRRPLRRQGRRADRRSSACSTWACRWAPAPTPPGCPATTRGPRCTGWSAARPSAAWRCTAKACRDTALQLFTQGSAWFSSEQGKKGQIKVGQLADLAALSLDFFSVDEEAIKGIESVLTVVDGKVVYGAAEFDKLARRCRCCRVVAGGQGAGALARGYAIAGGRRAPVFRAVRGACPQP